jgi:pyruvate,water dikinase
MSKSAKLKKQSILLGDAVPSFSGQSNGNHLYISLGELIHNSLFFHPEITQIQDELEATDAETLSTLLNGLSVEEKVLATISEAIENVDLSAYQTIRVALSQNDSDSFSSLLGGQVEPEENNPLLGLRGVSRFASEFYCKTFQLECAAIKALRDKDLDVEIVVPFVRTLSDAAKIIDSLAEHGLPRGLNGLKVLFGCDTPSAILLADRLLQYFDGLTINIENIAQLTLGVDRTNESLVNIYDEQNEAIKILVTQAAKSAMAANKPFVIICESITDIDLLTDSLLDFTPVNLVELG